MTTFPYFVALDCGSVVMFAYAKPASYFRLMHAAFDLLRHLSAINNSQGRLHQCRVRINLAISMGDFVLQN